MTIYRAPENNVSPFMMDWAGRFSLFFFRSSQNQKIGRGHWVLAPCQVSSNFVQRLQRNMSQPIRGQGGHLGIPIGQTNTNFVEDVKVLLPVTFRQICSAVSGAIHNIFYVVSFYQGQRSRSQWTYMEISLWTRWTLNRCVFLLQTWQRC